MWLVERWAFVTEGEVNEIYWAVVHGMIVGVQGERKLYSTRTGESGASLALWDAATMQAAW